MKNENEKTVLIDDIINTLEEKLWYHDSCGSYLEVGETQLFYILFWDVLKKLERLKKTDCEEPLEDFMNEISVKLKKQLEWIKVRKTDEKKQIKK